MLMDPAFAKDYERMLKVSELFNSEEEFFQCVRSFIQMEMFIQDDYDEFFETTNFYTQYSSVDVKKNGVSDENIADGNIDS